MKLQMLQVARLAPNLLRDSAPLVVDFLQSQIHPEGGFVDRDGKSDLYYTVFGIQCLRALRVDLPAEKLATYLQTFGNGDDLDLIHLTCLARCWSDLAGSVPLPSRERPGEGRYTIPPALKSAVLSRLANHRTSDGGYTTKSTEQSGSAYGCFLALGALQDLKEPLPDPEGVVRCLQSLAQTDGSYSNDSDITLGNTPATAAAVTILHQLQQPIHPRSTDWLIAAQHPDGGFFALPGAPMPDLLSTAVALHALSCAQTPIDSLREKTLDFIDTLWTNRGSFYGNWGEQILDVEYTWYALLALGHLAV
jgi:prenyltransferase beta subunit